MNSKNKIFFYLMSACLVSAFVQSSYAGDMGGEKEKKGEEDKKITLQKIEKIVFIKKYTPEGGQEEKTMEVFAIPIEPTTHYYTQNEGSNEVCIGLSQADFLEHKQNFPFAKFFGKEQDKAVIDNARIEAVRDHENMKRPYERNPGKFAMLVGVAGVTITAAASMFFK